MEPADFYTGIVAELYAPLKSAPQAAGPYAAFIDETGQPALELGCGDGDPMLDLLRRGYDVDGIDSSEDMLDRLRARAAASGLTARVFCQRMEDLDLPRRYRSIFLAGPTMTLLADDDAVRAALTAIRRHLADGGRALVPLFIPTATPAERIGAVTESTGADGAVLRVSALSQERDEEGRTQRTVLRYEKHAAGESTVEDREWVLHWHAPEGFEALAAAAGLRVVETQEIVGAIGSPGSEWTVRLEATP